MLKKEWEIINYYSFLFQFEFLLSMASYLMIFLLSFLKLLSLAILIFEYVMKLFSNRINNVVLLIA